MMSFRTLSSVFLVTFHNRLATVDAVMTSLMTVLAQRNTKELLPLLDVVSIRGSSRSTDAAGHLFNGGEVPSLALGQAVVHAFV
jgi:hypothetical protein